VWFSDGFRIASKVIDGEVYFVHTHAHATPPMARDMSLACHWPTHTTNLTHDCIYILQATPPPRSPTTPNGTPPTPPHHPQPGKPVFKLSRQQYNEAHTLYKSLRSRQRTARQTRNFENGWKKAFKHTHPVIVMRQVRVLLSKKARPPPLTMHVCTVITSRVSAFLAER
jgi:hypothetical protein